MKDTLVRLRKAKGMRQQDVADALGIARNTYTQYELGRRAPDFDTIKRLAAFHSVSVDYLLGNEVTESVQLLDLLSNEAIRLFVDDFEFSPNERLHLLTIARSFAEALKEGRS